MLETINKILACIAVITITFSSIHLVKRVNYLEYRISVLENDLNINNKDK